ncbi:MAG: hypothetical protein ACI977_000623 [Candidatus Nanohaloarchaea archaeon]|jgi:hypothetical protein
MTTFHEFVYSELGEPDSLDIVGLGPAEREYDNQWLYEMNRNFSRIDSLDQASDYWLGFEQDDRDYDIEGDVFEQDFYDAILDGDAAILVAPKPTIYRGSATEDNSYTSNYVELGELAKTGLDAVLMRKIDEGFEALTHLEYKDMADNFREGFQKKERSMQEMEPRDMANVVQNQPDIQATHLNWTTQDEEVILVTESQKPLSTL